MLPFRRPPATTVRLLLSLGVVVALGTACSSEEPEAPQTAPATSAQPDASTAPPAAAAPSAAAPSAAAAPGITIADFEYDVPESVPAGSELTVTNEDRQAHTFTVEGTEGAITVAGGETMTMAAPAAPGTYRITCDFHGDMTAELVVT